MRLILFLFFFAVSSLCQAQDLTGIWRGSFNSSDKVYSSLNIYDRYKFEVQIDDRLNKSFTGVTYSYKTTVFYGKATATGTINPETGKVMLQELKIVELKMSGGSEACIMTCFLQYSKNGDEEFLEGKYSSYNEKDSSFCGRGTVILRKVTTTDFYKEPFLVKREEELARKRNITVKPRNTGPAIVAKTPLQKPKTKLPEKTLASSKPGGNANTNRSKNTSASITKAIDKKAIDKTVAKSPERVVPKTAEVSSSSPNPQIKRTESMMVPRALTTRTNEVVKTLTFTTNDITINLYDNGTIDHDTISIYLDKKLVVSKQMLTTVPITVKLNLDENNPVHELVMVAENLGDIPPNTSLMVVKAGDKQYEVRITSTEQKNAVILFKYGKE